MHDDFNNFVKQTQHDHHKEKEKLTRKLENSIDKLAADSLNTPHGRRIVGTHSLTQLVTGSLTY